MGTCRDAHHHGHRLVHRRASLALEPGRLIAVSFTDEEIAYIRSQPLARIATVSADGQPDVVPVVFEFDGFHFFIGGFAPERTRRTRNIDSGNDKVALVIDDLATVEPWARQGSAGRRSLRSSATHQRR